ncbi:hypothetical protein [Jiangella alba]|uniref:hypothetical protein n=1 Tax=Jiangella alba TaxID=561176 RepID=UPI00083F3A0B|nr:hypothetical protein [Jiangella alba]
MSAAKLAAAGLIDVLASDYLPAALLPAAVQRARAGTVALPAAVGLHDRGPLTPGRRADLVLADLSAPHPIVHWVARAHVR